MVELKPLRSGPCLALAIAVLLLLVGTRSSACETVMITPTDLHPTEAVFIGTVAGIADPEQGNGQEAPARVKVKVRKSVQASPGKNVKEYTLLLYGLGADCSKVPYSRSDFLEALPLGTEVWVIGEVDPRNPGVVEVWDGSGHIQANKANERVSL